MTQSEGLEGDEASGSAEPETLDEARVRAPQSVRTLGRIVSLTDYQDFALAFAGIGKARADTLWSGQEQVVRLTVAPATDSLMDEEATVLDSLRGAIDLEVQGNRVVHGSSVTFGVEGTR